MHMSDKVKLINTKIAKPVVMHTHTNDEHLSKNCLVNGTE